MKQLLFGAITNAVLLAIAISAVRLWLNGLEKRLRENICELKDEDKELWNAINAHGHKGLDVNGSRVTR